MAEMTRWIPESHQRPVHQSWRITSATNAHVFSGDELLLLIFFQNFPNLIISILDYPQTLRMKSLQISTDVGCSWLVWVLGIPKVLPSPSAMQILLVSLAASKRVAPRKLDISQHDYRPTTESYRIRRNHMYSPVLHWMGEDLAMYHIHTQYNNMGHCRKERPDAGSLMLM